jgi:hypothetical protein
VVEERQLGRVGRLEGAHPPVKVGSADWVVVPGWLRVPGLNAQPEFLGRHLEVVKLDANPEITSSVADLIAFNPSPEPKIEDNA